MQHITATKKKSVRAALGHAVRTGKLTRLPCETCGETTKTEGHHDDYTRPFDVRWLCHKCHSALHPPQGPSCPNGHFLNFGISDCKVCKLRERRKIERAITLAQADPATPVCVAGHPQIPANLYNHPLGYVYCRECRAFGRLNPKTRKTA